MKKTTHLSKMAIIALIAFSGLCSAAVAAWADRDDWHRHARDAREWHQRHWHDGHVIYEDNEPYVTYAPPIAVEPPPVYAAPEPGLNIVVPLNIR